MVSKKFFQIQTITACTDNYFHDAFLFFVSTIHCSILGRNIKLGSFVSCEKTAKIYEISEIRMFPELDKVTL